MVEGTRPNMKPFCYLFAECKPLRDEVLDLIEGKKSNIIQRKTVSDRILNKILGLVDTFIN